MSHPPPTIDARGPASPAWVVLCPYLRDAAGEWRATVPTAEHRCTAASPPASVSPGTQRTLCLVSAHAECPLYQNARDSRDAYIGSIGGASSSRRPVPITAPVILERPTGAALVAALLRESLPQVALALVIALAIAAVVVARVIAP